MDLRDPRLYINRELSWLEFNHRVLEEASDSANPLLEQLKFLAIVSSNLDEFFMVRVAAVMRQAAAGMVEGKGADPPPLALLDRLRARIHAMVDTQYRVMRDGVLPALAGEGLVLRGREELTRDQAAFVDEYFEREVFPVLSPLALDPGHPLPHLRNLALNLVVTLTQPWREGGTALMAVVEVPAVLKRFVPLPSARGNEFILLGDVIRGGLEQLFLGYEVVNCALFRVTRDADLNIDEDEAEDLLQAIEEELRERDKGRPVRLEVQAGCDPAALRFLQRETGLGDDDTYLIDGPLNLKDFFALTGAPGFDHLRFRPFKPHVVPSLQDADGDVFAAIRRHDILLHHPFHSFNSVIEFVDQAADDPDVLAIKQTLYRTSGDSPIVSALARAAQNGKQVSVLVELKARFDEGPNIRWARELEEAGVHVVYGLLGLKTHCKVICVVRREGTAIRRYLHLGTGNYHPTTARLYTDLGLLTCDEEIGADVSQLFNILTGYSEFPEWRKLAVAPRDLKPKLVELIRREAAWTAQGRPGRLIAKCNAVIEPQVMRALYEASRAGVEIDLICRGICGLIPGLPGVSETIRVRSIVGRFLEHSRIFYFENGGSPELYLASADWMERNLDRRIETMFPVEDPALRDHIINDILRIYLADNAKARVLGPDGSWARVPRADGAPVLNAQDELLRPVQTPAPLSEAKPGAGARFLLRWLAKDRAQR